MRVQEAQGFSPAHNQRLCWVLILPCVAVERCECRRQDSNLRTVTDWDLIPAPLTKLGDSCAGCRSRLAYINTATPAHARSSKNTATSSRVLRWMSGTVASSAGYPTGITNMASSWAGRSSSSRKNPIGEGVWVRVTNPM